MTHISGYTGGDKVDPTGILRGDDDGEKGQDDFKAASIILAILFVLFLIFIFVLIVKNLPRPD
jgi:hypothetical protein